MTTMMIRALLALILTLGAPASVQAADCRQERFDGALFTICEVDLAQEDLRLFLRDAQGRVMGSFTRVEASLGAGERLGFAINAGMFHEDRSPVGLYIENGQEEMQAVTSDGPGNFGLLPNGVFCILDGRARVIETRAYAADPPACRHATQSGPMLVIDGALHPRFLPQGTSRNIRNGVGVDRAGRRAIFAISDAAVNFHHFGRLFRDHLGTPNALYLDGRVSRLYAPAIGRNDLGFPLGPILGTVVDADDVGR